MSVGERGNFRQNSLLTRLEEVRTPPMTAVRLLYFPGFSGSLPPLCNSYLRTVSNQFERPVPMPLLYCNYLEIFDVGNNTINGTLPTWLGTLQQLQTTMLRILDVSRNEFNGSLLPQVIHRSHVPQPLESEEEDDESYFASGFTWESVVIGYSCGLVVGTFMCSIMFKAGKPKWFLEGIIPHKNRRRKKRANQVAHAGNVFELVDERLRDDYCHAPKRKARFGTQCPRLILSEPLGNNILTSNVTHRIGVAWRKWRLASGVLCDKKIPHKLKGKFYRVVVRPALLYGAECWPVKNAHVQKMHVAEMRMLRWMCGHTRSDKIRNEVIREKVGVASVVDKARRGEMVWTCEEAGQSAQREGTRRGRGRPKKYWGEVIRQDMAQLHITEDMTLDRKEWRSRIKVEGDGLLASVEVLALHL
ncbi:hypothetical protein H5410_022935 [Solanum commersonii]|uniref:Uncharacterized protein n=1 Tax=Solanum commersonii TaxID=4109 RepID=A0A9J5ZJU2_SOLCO|nr:hypothetical protein H5410_022935 [Solanum commersonii]